MQHDDSPAVQFLTMDEAPNLRKGGWILAVSFILLLLCPSVLLPQIAESSASNTLTTTSTIVVVPVLLRSPSGEVVPILHEKDFLLTDNGVPQEVTLDDTEGRPLSLLVVLQTGASAPREFPAYAHLATMLSYLTNNHPYELGMITFDSQPEYIWDFSPDVSDLEDGFVKPGTGDRGAAVLDAINYGIDLLSHQPSSRRRIMIVISQNHDEGSRAAIKDIVQRLGENNITVECLNFSPEKLWVKKQFTGPRHENPLYQFSPGIPLLRHTFNLDEPLRMALKSMSEKGPEEIATLSGGESLPFTSKKELEKQIGALTNDLASTYTLSFHPTSQQVGFHSLALQIAGHPELNITARTSYWLTDTSTATK